MGPALAWPLLLLPLLRAPGGRGLSCNVSADPGDWSAPFDAACLNFSGLRLRLPEDRALRAEAARLLDLSHAGLGRLPPAFFAGLGRLRALNLTGNPLGRVDGALAARCALELVADCGCGLGPWVAARRDNCSDAPPLRCLDAGSWRNLSAFLDARCGPPGPGTVAALAAGAALLLGLAAAAVARGLRGRRDPRKPAPEPPAGGPPRPVTPDYENVILGTGPPPAGHGAAEHDFYMNYKGPGDGVQPVYCNLQQLGRAPLDEEEYVVPGR